MAVPEITRVEAYTELKRLKGDILLGMFHGVDSSEESTEWGEKALYARIDILLGRLEGSCSSNPEEWLHLTPFQAQLMNAMSHLSDSQEVLGGDPGNYVLVDATKSLLTKILEASLT